MKHWRRIGFLASRHTYKTGISIFVPVVCNCALLHLEKQAISPSLFFPETKTLSGMVLG
jgi:hypothetical protein